MTDRIVCLLLVLLLPAISQADRGQKGREKYKELVEQYEQLGGAQKLAGEFLALARQNPKESVALDALGWILVNVRRGEHPRTASELIVRDHLRDEPLGMLCLELPSSTLLEAEVVLRAALKKSPHVKVQAAATFSLAGYLQNQLKVQQALITQPSLRRRLEQFYGRPYTRHVKELDRAETTREIEQLYERVVTQFKRVDAEMTEAAQAELVEVRYLSVGRVAQDIEGTDLDQVSFKLSDYRGKVVVLSFWGHW